MHQGDVAMSRLVRDPAQTGDGVSEKGTTLVEALISIFLASMIFLSIAQLIGIGVYVDRASEDITQATTVAEEKVEELRNTAYAALAVGGSIDADVAGFFDTKDVDGDGAGDYPRRWKITDLGTYKLIEVRATSTLQTIGPAKMATLTVRVAQQ